MENKEYYLGLDMGTSSVGWAVTDMGYKILRARGKDMWGIREFEEAKSAENRRVNRVSRRRRQRELVRNGLLKQYFSDEINKVDPNFFIRLDNSKYYQEDKDEKLKSKNGIFDDEEYTDADYYKEFPTVFHLRKELVENKHAPYDVRLVYLAIANMFKHRGHFLLNGVDGGASEEEIKTAYESLVDILSEAYGISLLSDKFSNLVEILSNKELTRTKKHEEISDIYGITKKEKRANEFLRCICGLDVNAVTMFELDAEEKVSVCFGNYSYADNIPAIQDAVGDDNYIVLDLMKQIYDYAALAEIKKGFDYLSEARIASYDKHHEDLNVLKKVYRKHKSAQEYDVMFRSDEKGTYGAYVGSVNSTDSLAGENKYRRNMKGRSADDLYKKIRKELKGLEDDTDVKYIIEQMAIEQFLPKQLTGANGVIPNQIHKKELTKILENAESYLPFLSEKDSSGLTVSERIVQLFSFQIPYYVGPLGSGSKTGWLVRKEEGQILPWNIDEKVDMGETQKAFIENLIRECTYLAGEQVMPKSALAYEEYCVLNEINNIRIDGNRLDAEEKQKIYSELFQKRSKVRKKDICSLLMADGLITSEDQIKGLDKTINNSLSSYAKMHAIFGDRLKEDKYREIAEDIIFWGTIYGDSKKMFREKLAGYQEKGIISDADIKRILGYKFKDWGRFSKALLELPGCDKATGEMISLIQAMRYYSLNFMELINSEEFTFKESLEERKEQSLKSLADFGPEDLEEYYFSAPVKKMIWQTLLVLRDIEKVMGCAPKRIFIEMTRSDDEKGDAGRKDSRGKQLLEAYKIIKNTAEHDWKKEITEADEQGRLKIKKLYLYYMQMGRDMYTGEEIDIEDLFDNNKYDIDHIYPRHFVKDDSIINNLVLVNKAANEHIKRDAYPVPEQIRTNAAVKELWTVLRKKKLITEEKYQRLVNCNPFTENQLAGFIARQLVETGQGTKGVSDLLKQLMPETTIVYSKASNVSEFRRKGFSKSRIVNEFHHAHDAYLNIVVGNVYYTKFTQNPVNFIRKEYALDKKKNNYNFARMYDWDVVRGGETAWVAAKNGDEGTMKTVRQMLLKNTPLLSRLAYENRGELFNLQPISKYEAKEKNYVPLKAGDKQGADVTKYGGYTSLKPAYFIFLEHGPEKKRKKCFDVIQLYYADKIKSDEDLKVFCEDVLGYKDVRVICSKLKKDSLIKLDNYFLYLTGLDSAKKVEFHNATSLCVSSSYMNYIHKIEVSEKKGWLDKEITSEKNLKLYKMLEEKHLNTIFKNNPKPCGNMLSNGKNAFIELSLEEQVKTLYKILTVTSIMNPVVSLKEIGGNSESGRLRFSGNMTGCRELKLILQSPTGLFEKTIDLLK